MNPLLAQVSASGSALASWTPLFVILGIFVVVDAGLFAFGRSGNVATAPAQLVLRPAAALQRLTRIPGWAAVTIGVSLFGLLVAGQAFYSDVAWHVALGRDSTLFTAPHTGIVVGLGLILLSGVLGILVASLQQVDTQLRWRAVRIPWSTLPLLVLGGVAVGGFPLDDLWHRAYGVDVTMWSPTHMLMILGASFTGLAAWLVLADAGVRPTDSRWATGVHVVAAWFALQGLVAPLGEFAFGVPQFQQVFHPILLCFASAFGFVAVRITLGRFYALGIAAVTFGLSATSILGGGGDGPVKTKVVGMYVASALAVELAGFLLGVERRARFAVASGLGVATLGLAGEWWWNQRAYQPWHTSLLPDAVILGAVAGVGAALVAVAFARAAAGEPVSTPALPRLLVGLGAAAVVACIAIPLPRTVGDVTAALQVHPVGDGVATLTVTLDPPTAADHARWFQVSAWQGGGFVVSDLRKVGPGRYETDRPIPVSGGWKSLLRLHRGSELMAVPVFLPGDPAIGKAEIPAVDRTQPFEAETKYLLRETHGGNAWFKPLVYGLLVAALGLWASVFTLASGRIAPRGKGPTRPGGAPVGQAVAA